MRGNGNDDGRGGGRVELGGTKVSIQVRHADEITIDSISSVHSSTCALCQVEASKLLTEPQLTTIRKSARQSSWEEQPNQDFTTGTATNWKSAQNFNRNLGKVSHLS